MMLPVLYQQDETNFEHLGLGVLKDAVSCVVTEERNGVFELDMTYPLSGTLSDLLKTDMLIKVDASHEKLGQLFRIKRIDKNAEARINVFAEHISYLTQDLTMHPEFTLSGNGSQVMTQWLGNLIGDDNPFTVSSNVSVVRELTLRLGEFDNTRDVLGKILETWGGEYRIDNYHIELRERHEAHANTLISYGRNLTDLHQEENISQTFTSIQPYAIVRDVDAIGNSIQRMITSDVMIIDSDHVDKYPNRRILPVDFSRSFGRDEVPIPARLQILAREYIDVHNIGVPRVSIQVSFIDLTKTLNFNGLPSEKLELGDIVPVHFEELGIRTSARINRVKWNVLKGSYDSIDLGDVKIDLADQVHDLENDINTALTRPPVIDGSNIANVAPGPVANFKAVGGFSQIHLFWDFQGIHIDYYEIERSLTQSSGFVRLTRSKVSSYSDIVAVNQQFFYRVRAVNFPGIAGEWSEVDGAQTANALPIAEHEQRLDRVREIVADWCYDYPDKVTIDGGRIEANTITAREILAGTITGLEIAGGTIDATHIRAGAITTNHMAAGTISGDRITTGSLNATRITAGSITADRIAANAITSNHIQVGSLDGNRIRANTITAEHLAAETIRVGVEGLYSGLRFNSNGLNFFNASGVNTFRINERGMQVPTSEGWSISNGVIINDDRTIDLGTTRLRWISGGQTRMSLDASNGWLQTVSNITLTGGSAQFSLQNSQITLRNNTGSTNNQLVLNNSGISVLSGQNGFDFLTGTNNGRMQLRHNLIDLRATTINLNGAVTVTGNVTASGNNSNIQTSGNFTSPAAGTGTLRFTSANTILQQGAGGISARVTLTSGNVATLNGGSGANLVAGNGSVAVLNGSVTITASNGGRIITQPTQVQIDRGRLFVLNNNAHANDFIRPSSRSLKTEIEPVVNDYGLDLVNSLELTTYKYLGHEKGCKTLGVILEDTDDRIKDDTGEGISMNAVMWANTLAIQQLSKQINELRGEKDANRR